MNIKTQARTTLKTDTGQSYAAYRLGALDEAGLGQTDRLPCTIKILLEGCLRHYDGDVFGDAAIEALAQWGQPTGNAAEIPFVPGRVLLQDLTGVPALVDLAALRSAVVQMGGEAGWINPERRVDLVVDHSVQVDAYGNAQARAFNQRRELDRNAERYRFLKWGAGALDNFSLVPPENGIVHQVNLEHLAMGVMVEDGVAMPDTLVGTDSHTTMVNALGVLGWGVGGIEAEAAMLGQPIFMALPEVVGVRFEGQLPDHVTATDLVLRVTERLRAHGVVGKFVEFTGPGLDHLALADRATIANMAPEYGATMGYFPTDQKTLDYLELTGRSAEQIALVEAYAKLQGLWRDDDRPVAWSSTLTIDLAQTGLSVAGPARPQDRVSLDGLRGAWGKVCEEGSRSAEVTRDGARFELRDGAVVVAAITSCTNTSNPSVMLAAGLLAKRARALGLRAKPWVKTSLAPGSRVVTDYLAEAGLDTALEEVGFHTVGYGCTTCIGNTGPLDPEIVSAIESGELRVASVLSGNRNFEGRISPHTRGNFLASPPLVVAYALAGTVDIDLQSEPLGVSDEGKPVFLADIWPTWWEVHAIAQTAVTRAQFTARYSEIGRGSEAWRALEATDSALYDWPRDSTYIQEPPFFEGMPLDPEPLAAISGARCLVKVGDSVTTDHISPAGAIPLDSPAADHLRSLGVAPLDFNTYGARRGNDRIMARGTFGNIRLRNHLVPEVEGGYTAWLGAEREGMAPGSTQTIFEAAEAYRAESTPLVVLAGRDYGMGSSRDWAAKGPALLGVRAVIAASFERIHRTNLLGMGILPLIFAEREDCASLGLTGRETFDIDLDDGLAPGQSVRVKAVAEDGSETVFEAVCGAKTPVEVSYLRHGGILRAVLRRILRQRASTVN